MKFEIFLNQVRRLTLIFPDLVVLVAAAVGAAVEADSDRRNPFRPNSASHSWGHLHPV